VNTIINLFSSAGERENMYYRLSNIAAKWGEQWGVNVYKE
jgi:hypothetical protein